ncbi:encapsulin [Pelagibius sp. Alg239-R121]|uniref:encapsulin n=1 Tax=Pelagibius sp. Alg239-R121 TaxID=2993448 RepID=UPI0024A6F4DD|nr:encapsulin [Pelagibius sp. Alg239-R121]
MNELSWTEEQHTIVRDLIAEETERARLSHMFIPEHRLEEISRSVPADEFDSIANTVDDVKTIPLVEVAALVNLTKLQVEDSDLSAALLLIRRAANRLARAHDAVVFVGQPGADQLPPTAPQPPPKKVVSAIGGSQNDGVSVSTNTVDIGPATSSAVTKTKSTSSKSGGSSTEGSYGEALVAGVAEALVKLEGKGYIGSYVLILGHELFIYAHTPSVGSLVLPKDRLEGLLGGGPIHRSSVINTKEGFLLSLGGEPMDQAVAVAPKFEFLRIGDNEVRECRVFERFALRLKEKDSVVKLVLK